MAPALQRRPEGRSPPRARAHVRLDPRDDARADGPDGALRGGGRHAALRAGGVTDPVAGRQADRRALTMRTRRMFCLGAGSIVMDASILRIAAAAARRP